MDELGSRHAHAIVEAGPRRCHPRLRPEYHSLKGRTSSPCTVPCNHAVRVAKVGRSSCRCAQHARVTSYTAPGINLSTGGCQINGGHTPTHQRASWSRTCRSTRCCAARSRPRASSVARIAAAVDGAGNAVVADSAHAPAPGGCQKSVNFCLLRRAPWRGAGGRMTRSARMLPKPQKVARAISLSKPSCRALLAAPALLSSLLRAAPSRRLTSSLDLCRSAVRDLKPAKHGPGQADARGARRADR